MLLKVEWNCGFGVFVSTIVFLIWWQIRVHWRGCRPWWGRRRKFTPWIICSICATIWSWEKNRGSQLYLAILKILNLTSSVISTTVGVTCTISTTVSSIASICTAIWPWTSISTAVWVVGSVYATVSAESTIRALYGESKCQVKKGKFVDQITYWINGCWRQVNWWLSWGWWWASLGRWWTSLRWWWTSLGWWWACWRTSNGINFINR